MIKYLQGDTLMKAEFGASVFDFLQLKENLPTNIYEKFIGTVNERKTLLPEIAEYIAREIKKWAELKQVTHFTKWFLPLTGLTAGKQNTFLDIDKSGHIISKFSGKDLIKDEPDASSFPHGGMRSTFEARGYTAWDPSSPVFIIKNSKNSILYIPSVFFSYDGKVLDKKTPLLRSLKSINDISIKILKKFKNHSKWVKNMIGAEQEFFLIDEKDYKRRPDINTVGRTLFAARPPKGQQMGDHYFGSIPQKVISFLDEVEEEATKIGIPIKTRHNEVAPNQFEVAPIHEEANISADHNQILMELLQNIARKNKMVCLLHEKPFKYFNGSGKHINWSLMDSSGNNIFSLKGSKSSRMIFISFLAAFIYGVSKHNDLIQATLASAGNELRLGGNEAPPSIISIYLGEEVQSIIKNMNAFVNSNKRSATTMQFEQFIPHITHDRSDRNRTSPIAFTGNRFEFRMPGSSASISFPISIINLIIVDGLNFVYDRIFAENDNQKIIKIIGNIILDNSGCIFEGDNYSEKWRTEAEHRGLFIPKSIPHTISVFKSKKNVALIEKYNYLSKEEIEARADIKIEMYVKTIEIELRVARLMLRTYIIPAALKNQKMLIEAVNNFPDSILKNNPDILESQYKFIEKCTYKLNELMDQLSILDKDNEKLKLGTTLESAFYCSEVIRPHIDETALIAEKIEERVNQKLWNMPRISKILFR